jgi:NAD(P)-dependent dehydrogenase (short-subunit alcohol dehydrogenase family)
MAHQRVLVVGGGQGIGAAVTQNLVEKYGAKVVVLSLQVDPAIEQLGQLDKIRLIQGDATSSTVLGETFDAVETYLGGLDALVITMGVLGEIETVANLDMNKFRQAYEINLFTPIAIVRIHMQNPLPSGVQADKVPLSRPKKHCHISRQVADEPSSSPRPPTQQSHIQVGVLTAAAKPPYRGSSTYYTTKRKISTLSEYTPGSQEHPW